MSGLASALDELAGEDLSSVSDDLLASELVEYQRLADRFEAERLRRLREFDRRRVHDGDGLPTVAAWLRHNCQLSPMAARERVALARRLDALPQAAAALAAGDLTYAHARTLARLTQNCPPDLLARIEAELLEVAGLVDPVVFGRLIRRLRDQLEPDQAEQRSERRFERRRLDLVDTFDGMTAISGQVDAEAAAIIRAALDAVMTFDTADTPDELRRTPGQVRADALIELCLQMLDSASLPVTGGQRPHVVATLDLSLLDGTVESAELEQGGPITAEQALRIACDARVSRLLTMGPSQPIDVGRETETIPAATRRAMIWRDRHCRFPGCRRPPRWCEGHHIRHWVAHGGPTELDNLVLLCRFHHRRIHHHGFTVEHHGRGVFTFRRPDGTPLPRDHPAPILA